MNRFYEILADFLLVILILTIAYLSCVGAVALAVKWGMHAS